MFLIVCILSLTGIVMLGLVVYGIILKFNEEGTDLKTEIDKRLKKFKTHFKF